MKSGTLLLLPVLVGLSACAAIEPRIVPAGISDWRSVVTEDDGERLREWRTAFTGAIVAARRAGHGSDVDREGALLDPDAAIAGGPIPNGMYGCRVIKLGAKSAGLLDYVAYPQFSCRIEQHGDLQRFVKLTGSQRHVGLVFPGDSVRQVFLGTLVLGDESRAMEYGADELRNVAGHMERIGPARWRLVMPRPHFESQLDVIELVPEELRR